MEGTTFNEPEVGNVAALGCNVANMLRYYKVASAGRGEVAARKNLNVRFVNVADGGTCITKLDIDILILSV